MSLQIVEQGARLYVEGDSYSVKDRLKEIGCHWDGDSRRWWIGKNKRPTLEKVIGHASAPPAEGAPDPGLERDKSNILGTARYNGKTYYYCWRGQYKNGERAGQWGIKLLFRDGSKTFFKIAAEVEVLKSYERPQSLARLQEYARKMKEGGAQSGGDDYDRPVRGCGECRRLGRMCKQCRFDEYDC